MGLDDRGITAVVELIVYVPLLVVSAYLVAKHGFKREGWLYLLLLAIIRIIGASTHIASEEASTPNTNLLIVTGVMEAAGVSPLLVATLGFFTTVSQYVFDDDVLLRRGLRAMSLLSYIALALTIAGGVIVGTNSTPDAVDKINHGLKLRHIGVILFIVQYILTVVVTVYLWQNQHVILKQRRRLLKAITASIPFLGVRVLYSLFSAFAPTGLPFPGVDSGVSGFSRFNSTRGSFSAYLVMSVIVEFIVVMIYVIAGLRIPLQNDYAGSVRTEEDIGLFPSTAYAPGSGHIRSASSLSVSQKPPGSPMVFPVATGDNRY